MDEKASSLEVKYDRSNAENCKSGYSDCRREHIKMGMPLELNTMIVTKGKENRINENNFTLVKKEYRLYPMEIPIEVRKTKDSEPDAIAVIKKLEWENEQTTIYYELVSLNTTN